MQQVATVRSVKQAVRMLKHLSVQAPEWADYRAAGRDALAEILQERMHGLVGNRIAELRAAGVHDRRNGAYRRELLTSLGVIELAIPRSRTSSPRGVIRAYARREPWVDRVILACFVLGLSTRKVGEALLPILGERVSPATVSRVAKTLDDAVAAFHRRPLANRYRVLVFFVLDDPLWRQAARTTNAIERRFREVRRRTRPMGVFADRTSMERILFAVFSYENHKAGTSAPFLLTQNS